MMTSGAREPKRRGLEASVTEEALKVVDERRIVTDELLLSRSGLSAGILIIDDDTALKLFSLRAGKALEIQLTLIADVLLLSQFMSLSGTLVKLGPIACGFVPSGRYDWPDGMWDARRLTRSLSTNFKFINEVSLADLVEN